MIDVEKVHIGSRENDISVLGQRELHTNHFEPDVRASLSSSLACKGV